MRSSATRPRPFGTSDAVSEMPSAASRYGIFATDAAGGMDAVAVAAVHRVRARRERLAVPAAVRRVPVALPYTTFDVIVRIDCVWMAWRYVGYFRSLLMNVLTTQTAS